MATRASETTRMIEGTQAQATPRPHVGKQDRHFVTALSRGLDVLSCFRSGSRLLGNQDISERCSLPKSTVSRLTYTLTKLGYLHYVRESGKYRLGTATLRKTTPPVPVTAPTVRATRLAGSGSGRSDRFVAGIPDARGR